MEHREDERERDQKKMKKRCVGTRAQKRERENLF